MWAHLREKFILTFVHFHVRIIFPFLATQIDMGDEVATANNKMEFLLDKAEARIRDTALCGW